MMVMCDFLSPGLEDHASKRQKVDDATAEEILMRISNGDISDGDFSDDELEAENEENIVSLLEIVRHYFVFSGNIWHQTV